MSETLDSCTGCMRSVLAIRGCSEENLPVPRRFCALSSEDGAGKASQRTQCLSQGLEEGWVYLFF